MIIAALKSLVRFNIWVISGIVYIVFPLENEPCFPVYFYVEQFVLHLGHREECYRNSEFYYGSLNNINFKKIRLVIWLN